MKLAIIISIVLFNFLLGYAQISDAERSLAIDSIVNKYAKEYSIVGLSIGIVDGDKKITKHYGNTDLESNQPIAEGSMFHLASISKLYTATAIMQLVENNKLSLEDKLVDVLPNFKMKDVRHAKIKVKHLLTHSSGLSWDNKLKESPDDTTSVQLYIQNLKKKKLNFAPGGEMSYATYSNVAFDLLGAVVQEVSGQKFDEYVYENILLPLEMNQSTYYHEEVESYKLAIPHIVAGKSKKIKQLNFYGIDSKRKPILNGEPLDLKAYEVYGEDYEHNPSGNLISSAAELNLWMQHNLRIYANPTFKGILKHNTLKQMWVTQKETLNNKTSIGWGWWIRQDEKLGESVFHVGTNPGFCSILLIYPEKNFGITVLSNGWYAQEAVWNKITKEIVRQYIEN